VADHNDPNAVNSIFSDIDVSAADLYDIFGFPSDDTSPDEKVVIALTFAAVPHTGQVATRFLSTFRDMGASLNGKRYHVELLNDPALWNSAPVEPKTPPNPLKNDKEFLRGFPYLAEPW
jgi:hypothetical protein